MPGGGGRRQSLKRNSVDLGNIADQHSPSKIPNANNRTFNFETPNPFAPLANAMDLTQEDNTNSVQHQSSSVPPIFISLVNKDFKSICDIISDASTTKKFTTKLIHNQVKVMLENSDEYRNITKALLEANVEFHSFRDPSEKILSVVLKDVPTSMTEVEIGVELRAQDYPVLRVARLFNKSKVPMPVVVVELQDGEKSNQILNLNKLFYSIIKVEIRHKAKQVTQCTRCQRKGHTKNYCNLSPRCVKCTEDPPHATKDCKKKDRINPARCINCNGEHPANYRGCTYLKKIITRPRHKQSQNNPSSTHNISTQGTPSQSHQNSHTQQPSSSSSSSFSRSFADILKPQPHAAPNTSFSQNVPETESEPFNLDGSLGKIILSLVKAFLPNIKMLIKSIINEVLCLNND